MNKERRANIQKTIELLDKYKSDAEKIESSIKTILEKEEQHRDNIPTEPRYRHVTISVLQESIWKSLKVI